VLEVREAGIKDGRPAPARAVAQNDADTRGSGHVQVTVGIANQSAFGRGDPKPLAKAMDRTWIGLTGAEVCAPDALEQESEFVMV
jgi:hypothetical protein